MALVFMGFSSAMVVVSFVDFDHQIIPDEISLGGLVLGLVLVPVVHSLQPGVSYWSELGASALGAAIGAGLLWSVGFLHARLSVALGRSFPHWPGEGEPIPRPGDADYWLWFPGLGLGDVKLLAMIGAFLGPWGVFDTLLLASLIGLVVGVAWGVAQRNWSSPFGFGPALASGALLSLYVPPHEAWLRALVAGSGAGC
jgi:leader peptidase (prepilin peptidase)/N-methyltransferase